MKPVRTPDSNALFTLPGGNEDNYLYAQQTAGGEVHSVWELTDPERLMLAGGGRVRLTIFGALVPPVILTVVRPYCRECSTELSWSDELQAYQCPTCPSSP